MTLCSTTLPLTRAGDGALTVEHVAGASALTRLAARSPLKILVPRPRARSVWAYLSSFGGGFVAGDETRLEVVVGHRARCFLTTQASTKIYRNPSLLPCGHHTTARVGPDGLLVMAPDALQCYAGSTYIQEQEFYLDSGAGLVLLDWLSCGRGARGERWAFTRYASRNRVFIDGDTPELILLDSTRLDAADGPIDAPIRMGRFNCVAVLAILGSSLTGPAQETLARLAGAEVTKTAAFISCASPVRQGVLLRMAGPSVESVARALAPHLEFLRHELGDDPWSRKW